MSGFRHSSFSVFVIAILSLLMPPAGAQPYDILLKGGHVIDAANEIDSVMDVAVQGNSIRKVAAAIPESDAKKVVHVEGLYVTPGLIDLHGHVTGYSGALYPDDTALLTGTTTLVDAGGAGWRTFEKFREKIIDHSKTRVLALINIVGSGMVPASEGDLDDMDPEKTAAMIKKHRDVIVGIKHAHYPHSGWDAIQRAIKAGGLAEVPVMFDDKIFTNSGRNSREKLLDYMRPGDMHTHCYNDRQIEIISRFSGKVHDYAREARRRGVLFDLGHGGGSFVWPVATKAMEHGFPPDTISTDLHHSSIRGPQPDMPNCISKMMALGMSLEDAVMRSTKNPAKAIGKFPEIGTLGESKVADVTVLRLEQGVFAYKDAWGTKKLGDKKLEAVMTLRDGEIVFDLDGLAFPDWKTAGN
ncbi:MAG: amidohydrolase/deacetylase family metallohydrolase [Acidobacteria bacterium]|nr:amidohydrolase/deacetylase family metallohydrolase [Acidobacteriota bacterium]